MWFLAWKIRLMPPFSNHLTLFDFKMIYPKMCQQICVEFHFNIWTQSVPCCSTHPGSAYMEVRVVRTGRTMPMLGFALMEVPFTGETWGNHEFQKFHQMISEFDWICYVFYVVVFLDMMGASLFIINMWDDDLSGLDRQERAPLGKDS